MSMIILRLVPFLLLAIICRSIYKSEHTKTEEIYSDMYKIFSFSGDLKRLSYLDCDNVIHCTSPFTFVFDDSINKPFFYNVKYVDYYINIFGKRHDIRCITRYYAKISKKDYDDLVHKDDILIN